MHVWERGLTYSAVDRTLVLLEAACPDMSREEIANLMIGERDNRLLTLRQWLFGHQITSASDCPHCKQLMEWSTSTDALRLQPENDQEPNARQNLLLKHRDYQVEFRLPTTRDLVAVGQIDEISAASQALLKRCIDKIERKGKPVAQSRLPKGLTDRILAKMEQMDPQANLRVELVCANCQHQWEASFDIVTFLWSEIQSWAKQTLRAVHTLARAYGWREADILEMTPLRRQFYLEMTGY